MSHFGFTSSYGSPFQFRQPEHENRKLAIISISWQCFTFLHVNETINFGEKIEL